MYIIPELFPDNNLQKNFLLKDPGNIFFSM